MSPSQASRSTNPMPRFINPLKTIKHSSTMTTLPRRPLRELTFFAEPAFPSPSSSSSSSSSTTRSPTPPTNSTLTTNPFTRLPSVTSWAWSDLEEQDCLHLFLGGESVSSTPYQLFRLGHDRHSYPYLRQESEIRSKLHDMEWWPDTELKVLLAGIGITGQTPAQIKVELEKRRRNEIVVFAPAAVVTPSRSDAWLGLNRAPSATPEVQAKGKRKAVEVFDVTSSDEEVADGRTSKRKCYINPGKTSFTSTTATINTSRSTGKKPILPMQTRNLKKDNKSANQKILLPRITPAPLVSTKQTPAPITSNAQVDSYKAQLIDDWDCIENIIPANEKIDISAFDRDVAAFIADCDWQEQRVDQSLRQEVETSFPSLLLSQTHGRLLDGSMVW